MRLIALGGAELIELIGLQCSVHSLLLVMLSQTLTAKSTQAPLTYSGGAESTGTYVLRGKRTGRKWLESVTVSHLSLECFGGCRLGKVSKVRYLSLAACQGSSCILVSHVLVKPPCTIPDAQLTGPTLFTDRFPFL